MKIASTVCPFLFLVFVLVSLRASAQGDYLVTNSGDTVHGELKPLFYGIEKKIQVKNNDGKEVYSIFNTRLYRMDNDFYHPVKGPSGYTFMRLVKSGYLNLYRFQPENSSVFSGTYLMKADGDGMELPNLGFKKQMVEYLEDCEDVSEKIDNGELKKGDIGQIIDQYNACIRMRTAEVRQEIEHHFEAEHATPVWEGLEDAITKEDDFEGKSTAIEMINDIKNRVRRGEKVPNFIIDGLKNTLAGQEALAGPLSKALSTLNP